MINKSGKIAIFFVYIRGKIDFYLLKCIKILDFIKGKVVV